MQLRHAPRRKKGGQKVPAPCTPAMIPSHWKITPVGDREKPPPKEEVPDFGQWKKDRRKEVRVVGSRRPGETTVPATPGVAAFRQQAGSSSSAMTPALPAGGDATPFLPRRAGGARVTHSRASSCSDQAWIRALELTVP